ncbi:spermidine/putrescine ABC transporter permease protein [Ligilactobacillus salitolerans]|uniref:Spermidine/putrescine ABC transporter permease protein n=1 Tax=Ligilactobacillus salitolerans TaxID=1808352 RepID=A0A401IQF2_9LACO|nr:ABC transporter permease [Ligilactobacillus salitolerans]GBG93743.1 spermidine/putrescine ABC transporter permease protein [Ligilactobacillus salitolerans]
MKKSKFGTIYLIVIFIVLYLPIFYLLTFSFNAGATMNHFTGFSLVHFQELFSDTRLLIILLQTFLLAFLSALIATAVGVCGTLWISYSKKKLTKNALLAANNVLLVSPDVIIGASFLILFTVAGNLLQGFGLGFVTVLLSHVAFSVPIVVLMVLPQLKKMNESLVFAAQDLGANNWQALTHVILPYLTPGIIAGYFMAFTYSLDDFAVTFFVTGGGFTTLSVEIYSRARQGVSLEVNALSTLVFIFALILVAGYYLISKDDASAKSVRKKRGVSR